MYVFPLFFLSIVAIFSSVLIVPRQTGSQRTSKQAGSPSSFFSVSILVTH
jgi:hypothetical protein